MLPYEYRAGIHDQTRKAVERLPAKQVGYLQPFVNNSSECTGQSQSDLMLNYRSARRRFGKPPSCHVKPQDANP